MLQPCKPLDLFLFAPDPAVGKLGVPKDPPKLEMRTSLLIALLVAAAVFASGTHSSPTPTPAPTPLAGNYAVDSGHSGVLFRINHLGVANFWGRMNHVAGELTLDEDPSKCQVSITMDATSVDTNSEGRDKHVRGPDFFNVKEFPQMTFVSSKVKVEGDTYMVTGDLTIIGESQEITIPMEKIGEADTRMGKKCGFEGEFTFDRKDFGMKALEGPLGTDVRVILFIEANEKK